MSEQQQAVAPWFRLQQIFRADTGQMITERAYPDHVEYWTIRQVILTDGVQRGQVQVPYKIEATNPAEAFANADKSWKDCEESVMEQIRAQNRSRPAIQLATEGEVQKIAKGLVQ